nr:MAG TPA: hypothetical protein [Caudoviricetes sp.]
MYLLILLTKYFCSLLRKGIIFYLYSLHRFTTLLH